TRRVHRDVMHAVAHLGRRVGNVFRVESLVDGLPALAAVVGAERACGGNRNIHAVGIAGIENDGVQAHASGAGLPLRAGAMAAQAGKFVPVLAAIGRAKQRSVFDSGVDGVGIGERWLEMPDALELPGMLRAVIKLVRGERLAGLRRNVVDEFVAVGLGRTDGSGRAGRGSGLVPGFAAIVGALHDLSEPSAGLRGVDAIRIGRRAFEVINLPASEVRAADLPVLAFTVRRENECAFARAYQDSNLAHPDPPHPNNGSEILSEGTMRESTAHRKERTKMHTTLA